MNRDSGNLRANDIDCDALKHRARASRDVAVLVRDGYRRRD